MQTNQQSMTYAYHFLSEVIIMFLIALPFLQYRFFFVPYGSYVAIIVGTCIVFTIITRWTLNYFWYVALIPVLFGVFYLLDYPIIFATLFPILFVWRYMDIRNEEGVSRENKYLLCALILTAAVSILVNDSRVMVFLFLQLVILIGGYASSHLATIKREDRKHLDFKLPVYFVGALALSAGLFFLLFENLLTLARNVGQGFLSLLIGVIDTSTNVLSFIDVRQLGWPEQDADKVYSGDGYWNELEEFNVIESMSLFIVIAIVVLFLALFVFFVVVFWKRRSKTQMHKEEKANTHSHSINGLDHVEQSINRTFRNLIKRPDHPIRRMVYQFERKAVKNKKGRKQSETIEEWFNRIGINMEIEIYQKVRYGTKNVTDHEIEQLTAQLKAIETKLDLEKE